MRIVFAALSACLIALPSAAREIGPADLVHLPAADVVILGEVHDNPTHHANQAAAVAAIRPKALVFEMLTPEQAARAIGVGRKDAAALEKALGWKGTGWPDFSLYAPIFAAAPRAQIYGAALPVAQVRAAVKEGAAKPFGKDAARYGLTTLLPEAQQKEREADQMRDHCDALPPRLLPGMVAAQRLRDAAFARAVIQAYDQSGGPVVLITGSGHARKDWGVPAALAKAAPGLKVLSVGQIEGAPDAAEPFDLWLTTPPTPRPDPCEAFRKGG